MYVPLLGEAWDIVQRQPHIDELIFPFRAKSITQVFNQERKKLGAMICAITIYYAKV